MTVRHPMHRGINASKVRMAPNMSALPKLWLMTDERMSERLWDALAILPRGSGIVFRHFATEAGARAVIFARISRIARRRRLMLMEAGASRQPIRLYPVHSMQEAVAARRADADLILVSPVYPTRTHPGARALGTMRAATLARAAGIPAIALGGMTRSRFKHMKSIGFVGWAAIDGLTPR